MQRTIMFSTAFAGLLASTAATADLAVGSWNIKHFGWDNGKDMAAVTAVASRFDLLAIQELMDPAALQRLERRLERQTGEGWGSMASQALGGSSYQEHYGFLWRESQADYVEGAVVYLDTRDTFARPPYSASFADAETGQRYALGTVHITYGDSISDRTPEIRALDEYWRWLDETYEDSARSRAAGRRSLRRTVTMPRSMTTFGTIAAGCGRTVQAWFASRSCSGSRIARRETPSRIMRQSIF